MATKRPNNRFYPQMKKLTTLLFSIALVATTAQAQEGFKCGNVEADRRMLNQHPEILAIDAQLEQFTKEYAEQELNSRDASAPTYIIPVVFHIIHNYGPENISDAQIYEAIEQVNRDFRKLNNDTALTIPIFQSIAADSKIEFRLARKDPNGNCTNGIEHIQSELTYVGNDESKLNPWPRNKYLNVWVVNNIESGSAGYSYYPSSVSNDPAIDGILLLSSYVGISGASTVSHGHTLSHEIGHYLNLRHCWGSTNDPGVSCGSDNVNDTPETKGWTSCNLSGSTCNVGVIENVQNFMEYSYCSTMFTVGQRTRMHAALNSSTSGRNNLWTTANLIATGTDNLNYVTCAPIPNILPATQQFVCAGDTVFFSNVNYNGVTSSWNWTFPNGTPAASTDSTPYVIYTTPGSYSVSLATSNASGSNSTTQPNYVTVLPNTAQHSAVDFIEPFESMTFPNNEWVEASLPGLSWTRPTNVGFSGTASLMVNTQSSFSGQVANFITPTVDFTGLTNPIMTFRLAHARVASTDVDNLRIYVSRDCGQTWKLRYSKSGSSLATTTTLTGSNYVPSTDEWRLESVNMALYANEPNVRFRFEYTQKGGNNIYIDDINFGGTVSTEDVANKTVSALSIFPNPVTNGEVAASFNLTKTQLTTVKLVAADGRSTELASSKLEAGHQLLRFDTRKFPVGYYTLWIQSGNETYSRSVIIKR